MKREKILYGTKLPVKLTIRERDIIRDETFCDPDFAKIAVADGKGIQVDLSLDEIEEIQGYVAAEANHTKNKKIEKELGRLLDKLQTYLDRYDDQENENMIVHNQPAEPFTKGAKERWGKIPKWAQTKILDNAFCRKCLNTVPMILETAKMERANLILRGKCKVCGQEVSRLVEPEGDI